MMSFIQQNMHSIKNNDCSRIYEKLQKIIETKEYVSTDNITIEYEEARDKSFVPVLTKEDKKIRLNSTFKPEEEAIRFANKLNVLPDYAIVLFQGLGNGVIVREVIKNGGIHSRFMIYEPSIDLFLSIIEQFDLSDLFDNKQIEIYVEGINEGMLAVNLGVNMTFENKEVSIFESHPKYKEMFELNYYKLLREWERCKLNLQLMINTAKKAGEKINRNVIMNIEHLVFGKAGNSFINAFPKDLPAIIVSAGPSLENDIEILKTLKGKAFIIAVDSVLKFLLKHAFVPDAIATLDYKKYQGHFPIEICKGVPIIVADVSSNDVINTVGQNDIIFASSSNRVYADLLKINNKSIEEIPTGGSVACFAFAVANHWQFKKIVLIGQDLAINGKVFHAGRGEKPEALKKYEFIKVPGNYTDVVMTRGDFYNFILWFNKVIEFYSDVEVINATSGGAKLNGAKLMPLVKVRDELCVKDYKVNEIIDGVLYSINNKEEAYNHLLQRKSSIKKLMDICKDGMINISRLVKLFEQNFYDAREISKYEDKIEKLGQKFFECPEMDLIASIATAADCEAVSDIYIKDEDINQESIRLYRKMYDKYERDLGHLKIAYKDYESMLEKLKNRIYICQQR